MKIRSEVEFTWHFGKIRPPIQYTEIHLITLMVNFSAILDCRLPYWPIWWIHVQFARSLEVGEVCAVVSWNKGCSGRITFWADFQSSPFHESTSRSSIILLILITKILPINSGCLPSAVCSNCISYWRPRLLFLQHEFPIPKTSQCFTIWMPLDLQIPQISHHVNPSPLPPFFRVFLRTSSIQRHHFFYPEKKRNTSHNSWRARDPNRNHGPPW